MKIEELKYFVNEMEKDLQRQIVAVPNEEYLNEFSKANNGSNDFLLMQMSKMYGYKLAVDRFKEILNGNNQE